MKKIKLSPPEKINGKYSFYLGSNKKIEFKNVLLMQKFLADTNKFYTDSMYLLNYLFGEIYREYRMNWVYLDTDRTTGRQNKIAMNRTLQSYSENIQSSLDFMYMKSAWKEGPLMVINNLYSVANNLVKMVRALADLNYEKSYFSVIHKCLIWERQLETLKMRIQKYPERDINF